MRHVGRLLAPNLLVAIFALLGLGGLVGVGAGLIFQSRVWVSIGIWLLIPLILGGVSLITVVIPILIYINRKGSDKG